MTRDEKIQALKETIDTCLVHLNRISYAKQKFEDFLPLTLVTYNQLNADQVSYLDQFLFRFTKLQDTMGNRLFPFLLEVLAEPVETMAFIDLLNRLEKLEIIPSTIEWIELRRLRNDATHEYPQTITERINGLNILFEKTSKLEEIIDNCQQTVQSKIN